MTERGMVARQQWLPSALPALFGEEPAVSDPWPALIDAVSRCDALTAQVRAGALRDAADVVARDDGILLDDGTLGASPSSDLRDVKAPMRVVLMGRTTAGKSSLLSAMTGSHFDRIGDGRQRFSRDVFPAAASLSEDIDLIDTPGVGAFGGADDTEKALRAALEADVVVWVNSSDSIQEESAESLRLLGAIGKPIIVVINCGQRLDAVGRARLMKAPDKVFGNKEGLIDEIRRHMAQVGVAPVEAVCVHALAAAEALARPDVDQELLAASRIEKLTEVLRHEHQAHNETRRALRIVDGRRQLMEEFARSLGLGAARFRAQEARDRQMTNDVHARLNRVVRTTGEAMASDVESAVGRRRDWHLTVTDFGKAVQSDWDDEVAAIQDEVTRSIEARLTSLATEAQTTVEDADAEWKSVSLEQFALRDLSSFSEVWGNRISKVGLGVAGSALGLSGGAWLGGQIGAALGVTTGPGVIVTAGAGMVVGGIAGLAAGRLKPLVDHLFLGKDGVLRKRREEIAKQVGPILDELAREYEKSIDAVLDDTLAGLARERARSDEHAASLEHLSSQWTSHGEHLCDVVRDLDRATASALLMINRRGRLARLVKRATRVPGVCILAEFDDVSFWESWLFPPDLGETLAGGKPPPPGGEAASALSYVLSLVDASARLVSANDSSALLGIEADVPPAITETWSAALTAHTGRHIQIETTTRTRSSQ